MIPSPLSTGADCRSAPPRSEECAHSTVQSQGPQVGFNSEFEAALGAVFLRIVGG